MGDHNIGHDRLDAAIDATVRDIMQLDPRPGLRRRVLSQLHSPAAASSWTLRVLVPAGALTSLVAALFVLAPREQSPAPVATSAPAVASSAIAPATMPTAAAAVPPPPVAEASSPRERHAPRHAGPPRKLTKGSDLFGSRTGRVTAASVPLSASIKRANSGQLAHWPRPLPLVVVPGLVIPPLGLPPIAPAKRE